MTIEKTPIRITRLQLAILRGMLNWGISDELLPKFKANKPLNKDGEFIDKPEFYKRITKMDDGFFSNKEVHVATKPYGFESQLTNIPKYLAGLIEQGWLEHKRISFKDKWKRERTKLFYRIKQNEKTFLRMFRLFYSNELIFEFANSMYYDRNEVVLEQRIKFFKDKFYREAKKKDKLNKENVLNVVGRNMAAIASAFQNKDSYPVPISLINQLVANNTESYNVIENKIYKIVGFMEYMQSMIVYDYVLLLTEQSKNTVETLNPLYIQLRQRYEKLIPTLTKTKMEA